MEGEGSARGRAATAREEASSHRREAERARTALDSAAHEHRASAREAEVRQAATIAGSVPSSRCSRPARGAAAQPTKPRARGRALAPLQREHRSDGARQLPEEVDELRRENDGLFALHRAALRAGRAQGELKAQAKLAEADRASHQRRAPHLQQELDAASRSSSGCTRRRCTARRSCAAARPAR